MLKNVLDKIYILAEEIGREVKIMEVCGTHTQAIAEFGLRSKLPENIKLITGPGCPVCVTDQKDIDSVIALARAGVPIATYGDLLRVPGSAERVQSSKFKVQSDKVLSSKFKVQSQLDDTPQSPAGWRGDCGGAEEASDTPLGVGRLNRFRSAGVSPQRTPAREDSEQAEEINSLEKAREEGAFVKEVYSVEEALELQKEKQDLVFFGLGFETTAPMSALAVKKGLNFYSTHKLFIPAMAALLEMDELKIDGFIDPGHVSAIVGVKPYRGLKKIRPIHQVIAGFEALDVLLAIYMLLSQIIEKRFDVENEYDRLVLENGNVKAMELINEVFEVKDGVWRGFGIIPNSGLELKNKFKNQDAKIIYKEILNKVPEPKKSACACGEVIRGLLESKDCPLFGKICAPQTPYGPCMVSVEGGCNNEVKSLTANI
ncbi:MAG: hydrogenase formation protein HypD [bacterium]